MFFMLLPTPALHELGREEISDFFEQFLEQPDRMSSRLMQRLLTAFRIKPVY